MNGGVAGRTRRILLVSSGVVSCLGVGVGCIVVPSQSCGVYEDSTATVVVAVPAGSTDFDLEFELEERDGDAFPPFALYCDLVDDEGYECSFSRLSGYDFEVDPFPMPMVSRASETLEIEFDVLTKGRFSRLAGGRITMVTDDSPRGSAKGRTSKYQEARDGECGVLSYADMFVDLRPSANARTEP